MIQFTDKSRACSYQQIYAYKGWCLFYKLQYDSTMLMELGEETAKWLYQHNPQRAQPKASIELGCHIQCGIHGRINRVSYVCNRCDEKITPDVLENLNQARELLRLGLT